MRLTTHFTREEMQKSAKAEQLGISNEMPDKYISNALRVAVVLEVIRANYGSPLTILSCFRSPEVNLAVGGSKTSAHLYALACDFIIAGVSVKAICEWVRDNIDDFDQVIYETINGEWVHIGFSYNSPRKQCLTAVIDENEKTVYKEGIC